MKSRLAGRTRLAAIATAGALAGGLLLPIYTGAAAAAAAPQAGPPNTWAGTGQMGVARSRQTATLVAGGGTSNSELYNPATGKFSPTGALPLALSDATATLLQNGKVLVAGGLE